MKKIEVKRYELDSSREDYLRYLATEYKVSLDTIDLLSEKLGDIDQYGGTIGAFEALIDELEVYCEEYINYNYNDFGLDEWDIK
jgi:hypothetical protein